MFNVTVVIIFYENREINLKLKCLISSRVMKWTKENNKKDQRKEKMEVENFQQIQEKSNQFHLNRCLKAFSFLQVDGKAFFQLQV